MHQWQQKQQRIRHKPCLPKAHSFTENKENYRLVGEGASSAPGPWVGGRESLMQSAWDVQGGSQGGALVTGMSPCVQKPSGHQ